jgi:hypothetical protein
MRSRLQATIFELRFTYLLEEYMINRSNVKLGISGALLLIIVGAFSACGELPTDPDEDPPVNECVWIDGTIHCY